MDYIIGIDGGTNSIGFSLLIDKKLIEIGSDTFPMGNKEEKGIEKSKNAERRGFRGTRRNRHRYHLRRNQLEKRLKGAGMWPDFTEKKSAFELYQMRSLATTAQISLQDLGRILMLFNKYRGFKSNSKQEKQDDDDGKVATQINWLKERLQAHDCETIGQYFFKMFEKSAAMYENGDWHNPDEPYDERSADETRPFSLLYSRGIRRQDGRHVEREMLENEFDIIWKQQQKYYPETLTGNPDEYKAILNLKDISLEDKRNQKEQHKSTAYWQLKHYCIFYHRPLKSPKRFVGKCGYEKTNRCAPKSSFLYQEFRILKQLADLRLTDKFNPDILNKSLDDEQRGILFLKLQNQKKISFAEVKKELGLAKTTSLNSDNEAAKDLIGNVMRVRLLEALSIALFDELDIAPTEAKRNLDKLWHVLYMSRDDQWLRETLSAPEKWNFDDEIVERLIKVPYEEGYANYSAKVLHKIVPLLKQGFDERAALVKAGYLNDKAPVIKTLKNKVKGFAPNELRNPVVEKSANRVIKLVNNLIKKHNIDPEKLTIRIESTRELKKPRQERQKIRGQNLDTEKRRKQYSDFLNKSEIFKNEIHPDSPEIKKFELWLELGEERDDFAEFKKFVADSENYDKNKEKLRLWTEQGFKCPYTFRPIPLGLLFSPEIEIEHIIPYSRSMDNSFINKTVCFATANRDKKAQTAYEYMAAQGGQKLELFKQHIQAVFGKSKEKQKRFLQDKVEATFRPDQLTNTAYTARVIKQRLQDVSRNVQFTNGAATGELRRHWKIKRLLEQVIYEESTGIDMSEVFRKERVIRTDEDKVQIEIYENWLAQFGRAKNRSDHRHHALDSLVIALCSPEIIRQISTFNRVREERGIYEHDNYVMDNANIRYDLPKLEVSKTVIKEALKQILVSSDVNQRLLVAQKNNFYDHKHSPTPQRTYSVRGGLHDENFFGKLKNPKLQGLDKEHVYVKRVDLTDAKFETRESLKIILDEKTRTILEKRFDNFKAQNIKDHPFSVEGMIKNPVYMYSLSDYPNDPPTNPSSKNGKPLPVIKKVRIIGKNVRSFVPMIAKNAQGEVVNTNRHAEKAENYIMALYEKIVYNKKGEPKSVRDFRLLSGIEAVKLHTETKQKGEKILLFLDEKTTDKGEVLPLMKTCPYLKKGDFVVFFEDSPSEILWNDKHDLSKRLYQVTGLSSMLLQEKYEYGTVSFAKHNAARNNAKYEKGLYSFENPASFMQLYHTQINAIKVEVTQLGEVLPSTI